MVYRKFRADRLFTGSTFAAAGSVLVTTQDGVVSGVLPPGESADDVEQLEGTLSPGFINCHCHLELSHLAGQIPAMTGMVPFLLSVLRLRGAEPEFIVRAAEAAEAAMIRNGIVAVGDICNTALTIPLKQKGRLRYHNFIEVAGTADAIAAERFAAGRLLRDAFREAIVPDKGSPLSASVVPHAAYSVSPVLHDLIMRDDPEALIAMHSQESADEIEWFASGGGAFRTLFRELGIQADAPDPSRRGLSAILESLGPDQRFILVHNVFTSEEDLMLAGHIPAGCLFWCLCPNANLYITGSLPDVELIRSHGARIVIGTDSLASNRSLDVLGEMKTIQQNFPGIGVEELLGWATLNGAEALGMAGAVGSFGKGKRPGVLLLKGVEGDRIARECSVQRIL